MASRSQRPLAPFPSSHEVSVSETLSRLGMTREQFAAKQAELSSGLLCNQPFVPRPSAAAQQPSNGRHQLDSFDGGRSRSTSVSSSSSRNPSPAPPRTPARHDRPEGGPSRPRDQMEMILEEQYRKKVSRRRDSTSRSRDGERVFSTPSHAVDRPSSSNWPPVTPHHYRYYSERVVGEASASKHASDSSDVPETPSRNRERGRFKVPPPRYNIPKTPSRHDVGSSLPTTPRSSSPPVVNLVSSPGPMRPDPPEEEHLPFILPPGPYSTAKPELSYAAIIGRAILSSPGHALALQDIYEYITTVFPYYRRGEPTWMNSVRHALSTMAVFRKERGRAEGKSLWAVYDCDLPCFEGGGFKKALCADMQNGVPPRRKRATEDGVEGPRSKRRKGNEQRSPAVPSPVKPPFFPHVMPNPNHQSYYEAAWLQQQQVPADVLFPPLPASSNFHRVVARAASIPVLDVPLMVPSDASTDGASTETEGDDDLTSSSSPIERPPSSSSLPDLVSSLSTSSSPTSSSHLSLPGDSSRDPSPAIAYVPPPVVGITDDIEGDPMAAWLRSDSPPPAITYLSQKAKGKAKAKSPRSSGKKQPRKMAAMHPPTSPTPERRGMAAASRRVSSSTKPRSPPKVGSSPFAPKPVTAQSVLHQLNESLVASAIAAEQDNEAEGVERPSTPDRIVTPPPPSTPLRVEDLEAELIDFSPFKSLTADIDHLFGTSLPFHSLQSPVFSARAPLLGMGSVDDFVAGTGDLAAAAAAIRSPAAPAPRTPKRSPFLSSTSAGLSVRIASPFGTPSRSSMRDPLHQFDDDLAQYFSSANDLFAAYTTLANSPTPSHRDC
ncbi:hypothetical protein BD311DRAFT_776632 [Dichomitus squalens]|uniref:Fork-head domain-containing protein n=1 Tax=Dichomitus squalens TaxID=114155 RepID=A0A4Q9MTW2_9APHY|nr:hypothetical protein BD311DRAFT_776632 [Dichomitus squalens]